MAVYNERTADDAAPGVATARVSDGDWSAARALVLRYGWNAVAYQILNPGMRLWFSSAGDAVAGYVTFARVRVVAGSPVCAPERLRDVANELEAEASASGERVLFFSATTRLVEAYAGREDHSAVRLGAQPAWDPSAWRSIVEHKASLRAQLHRAQNKGVRIEEWPARRSGESPRLRAVLKDWLRTRGLPPLAFLVTPDLLDTLDDRRVFVALRHGDVIAFLIATPVPSRAGWLVEQWPRLPSAPNGTTHLMVDAAMRTFASEGAEYVTLGMAPLAEHAGAGLGDQPAWLRGAMHWARAHGRRFYNFEGLEAFKAGMQPSLWEPVYAIAPGERFTPGMLRSVAGAFSAGSPERLFAIALGRAAREEVRRAAAALSALARRAGRG